MTTRKLALCECGGGGGGCGEWRDGFCDLFELTPSDGDGPGLGDPPSGDDDAG